YFKMTNQTEHNYLKRILRGDIEAFSYFVDTYKHMAFTIAVRIVQNREDAEDIVQESFIKCFHSLGNFKGDSKFSTWLYRIVYHSALDVVRSQKRSLDIQDRKSTRLNSSHVKISYAVFCLKKKKKI